MGLTLLSGTAYVYGIKAEYLSIPEKERRLGAIGMDKYETLLRLKIHLSYAYSI